MAGKRTTPSDINSILAKVDGDKSILEFRNKQIIYSQGDSADSVFYIQKGRVKVTVLSERGKEAVIAVLDQGQFFGEGSLVTGHPLRMSTTISMGHSTVVRFKKDAIVRLVHDEPAFADLFLSYVVARTVRVEEDLVDQLFNSTEKRLARVLLLLAGFGREGQPQKVTPKISQETLAQMIGADRSRVSSFMNKFKKLGFIDCNGGLQVFSSLLNVVLHD